MRQPFWHPHMWHAVCVSRCCLHCHACRPCCSGLVLLAGYPKPGSRCLAPQQSRQSRRPRRCWWRAAWQMSGSTGTTPSSPFRYTAGAVLCAQEVWAWAALLLVGPCLTVLLDVWRDRCTWTCRGLMPALAPAGLVARFWHTGAAWHPAAPPALLTACSKLLGVWPSCMTGWAAPPLTDACPGMGDSCKTKIWCSRSPSLNAGCRDLQCLVGGLWGRAAPVLLSPDRKREFDVQ